MTKKRNVVRGVKLLVILFKMACRISISAVTGVRLNIEALLVWGEYNLCPSQFSD